MPIALLLPVLNPGPHVHELVASLEAQTLRPDEIHIVDSSSTDGSLGAFERLGARVHVIPRSEFDHGGTRNLATRLATADMFVFLTQDALPEPDAIERLVQALVLDASAGMAYGRQLPHRDAGVFGAHARSFNYPDVSRVQTLASARRVGVKAAFCSNSFAAYKRVALESIGGFPERLIFGEDTYVAARLLEREYSVLYVAEACVRHSHDYTLRQDFSRYFDAGVFHATERWYVDLLGGPSGEGMRFVRSELAYVRAARGAKAVPGAILRNAVRWLGYQTGRRHALLPQAVCARVGMNRGFWRQRVQPAAAGDTHLSAAGTARETRAVGGLPG